MIKKVVFIFSTNVFASTSRSAFAKNLLFSFVLSKYLKPIQPIYLPVIKLSVNTQQTCTPTASALKPKEERDSQMYFFLRNDLALAQKYVRKITPTLVLMYVSCFMRSTTLAEKVVGSSYLNT